MSPKLYVLCGLSVLVCLMPVADALNTVGCYQLHPGKAVLTDYKGHVSTARQCVYDCKARGKKYAGVTNGKDCYCGNGVWNHGRSNGCYTKCQDGPYWEKCGGTNLMTVYKVRF